MPDEKTVLNFAVAVDASADVPLLAWFDLDDEWLKKAPRGPRPFREARSCSGTMW